MNGKGRNQQGGNPWQQVYHVWLHTDLLQALMGEPLSSVFSTDGTLISTPAAPHCRVLKWRSARANQFHTLGPRISPHWLNELRRLWTSVPWRVACELVSVQVLTLCLDSMASPLRLRWATRSLRHAPENTVRKFVQNSAPKTCEPDPVPISLLMECLDIVLSNSDC